MLPLDTKPGRVSRMHAFRKTSLVFAAAMVAVAVAVAWQGHPAWRWAAVAAALSLPTGVAVAPALAGFQYTLWIVGVVVAGLVKPELFLWSVGGVSTRSPLVVITIVQLVMFGMGTKMSLRDFAGVAKMPQPVLVGVALQFTVMPLVGFSLAKLCGFPPEIGAGVVLIGSCSSGLASNVMCYLAGANLPLSITLTAVATLLAPLVTPFWMTTLVGETVQRSFSAMAGDIIKMTIVPIGAAMLHDYLKTAPAQQRRIVGGVALACAAAAVAIVASGGWSPGDDGSLNPQAMLLVYSLAAPAVGLVYHLLVARWPAVDRHMHYASMFGIIYFTAVTTAAGRDNLLAAGLLLCLAAAVHNMVGYAAGYWLSRAAGLDRQSALTVGFEVGMQNGGMAAGMASAMNKLGTVGLAAAVFSPWMNVTGSLWANYLRRRRPSAQTFPEPTAAPTAPAAAVNE